MTDFHDLSKQLALKNVTPVKVLRSYTGKAQSIASLLFTWRPWVAMLWAAMYSNTKTKAPPGCVWYSQIAEPVSWFIAFGDHLRGTVERHFSLGSYLNKGKRLCIYVDASPYGLGGWIAVDDVPLYYFADRISAVDCKVLGTENAQGSQAQQAYEALALLVVLRLWLKIWAKDAL